MDRKHIRHGRNFESVYSLGDIEHMGELENENEKESERESGRGYRRDDGREEVNINRGIRWKWLDVLHNKESECILLLFHFISLLIIIIFDILKQFFRDVICASVGLLLISILTN